MKGFEFQAEFADCRPHLPRSTDFSIRAMAVSGTEHARIGKSVLRERMRGICYNSCMPITQDTQASSRISSPATQVLVRYGAVPEVARFAVNDGLEVVRGGRVVVQTHRGRELGLLMQMIVESPEPRDGRELPAVTGQVLRLANLEDAAEQERLREQADAEFAVWERRIVEWEVDLQLIDLEWTLDGEKLVLYVLNERGPECTKLALQAAAAGLGIVEVQPVSSEGLKPQESGGGGCGSCGH